MRLNEFTEQSVEEGYYDLNDDGMQPIDFSSNPSFKELVTRYTQLVYQGHTSETSPEEDQEYDDIEQYVAQRFGEKGSAHLQKAGEVSYWGRDDKPYGRDSRSSNLGRPNQPGGNFRTTKAGKMHGQDAKMMKAKVADRLGRHPEPTLPEGVEQDVSEVWGDKDRHINDPLDGENIFTGRPGVSKRALARLKALLTVRLFAEDELRMMHLYDVVQDKQLFDIIKYAKRHAPPKTDLRNYEPFSSRIQTLIARAEKKLNLNQSQEQGVAEGWKDKVAGAAMAGSMALGGAPAHAGFAGDLAQSAARGLGAGVVAGAAGPSIFKKKNAADLAFAEQIPDEEAKAKFLKAVKYMRDSRNMSLSDPSMMGANAVDEARFKKIKQQLASKYNIQVDVQEGVAEGIMNTIANKVMGAAPEQPKYQVGQRVKYETNPHQPDWKDGGSGVGVITAYKNGHYMINGNPVNHFEIKGVVEQGVAEGNYDDNRTGFTRGARDDERHDLDTPRPTIYALKINGKIWQKDGNVVTFFTKERALAARNSILNKRPELEVGLVQRQD